MTIHDYIHNGGVYNFSGEPLFNMLNHVVPSFFVLVAIISAVFVYIIYRLISGNLPSGYVWVGVFIFLFNPYLFLVNLSALRQCLAMCAFIIAVNAAYKKRFLLYVVLVAIGALCHKSAWVLLPVYFFINAKPVKKSHVAVIAAAILMLLFAVNIQAVVESVAVWFDSANYIYHATQGVTNTLRATLLTSIFLIYTLFNLPKLQGKALVYGKLCLVSCALGVLAFRLSMLTRIQMYFEMFSVVALPQIYIAVKNQGPVYADYRNAMGSLWHIINRYALPILIVVIYLLRYYSFFTNPMWESFVEYHTIFSLL